jgi:Skp family chaperone for outer membrane proteins
MPNQFLVVEVLKSIQDSKDAPSLRFARFKRDATLAIATATGFSGIPNSCNYVFTSSSEFDELFDGAATVLRGISLDAWNNHQDRTTAIAAIELAIWHAKSRELKQRLAEDRVTLKKIRGQSLLPPALSRLVRNVVLSVMGISMALGALYSCVFQNNSSSMTSHTQPADTNSGDVYYVSAGAGEALDEVKAEIETQQMQLQSLDDKIEQLGKEIEKDRSMLDTTSQSATDEFNRKVDRYNALLQEDKDAAAAVDQKINAYNAALKRYAQ